jgi:hypothetical protein
MRLAADLLDLLLLAADGAVDRADQIVDMKGLLEEIDRARMHGLDRGRYRPRPCQHHDLVEAGPGD